MTWNDLFPSPPSDQLDKMPPVPDDQRLLLPLADYRLILVRGPDAHKFLQGQLTCDITALENKAWVLGAHCTAKGRMISSFLAAQLVGEDSAPVIGLRVHVSIADTALAALKKYAVFSKVDLSVAEKHVLFAVQGDVSAIEVLPQRRQFKCLSEGTVLHTSKGQCEIWCAQEGVNTWISQFGTAQPRSSSRLWRLKNIAEGLGEVDETLAEKLLPQEMNFQLTEGISFSKGCYTGQEIIARLHYRGQMKKHMRRATVASNVPVVSTQAVFSSTKNVGMIFNVAQSAEGQYECLLLCDDSAYEACLAGSDVLQLNPESPVNLSLLPLPYAIN